MQPLPGHLALGLLFSCWLVAPVHAQGNAAHDPAEQYPSEQLLEFLADFGEVDEQTYELIEYHALQHDRKQQPQAQSDNE